MQRWFNIGKSMTTSTERRGKITVFLLDAEKAFDKIQFIIKE